MMTAPFFKSYEDMLDYYYWQPLKNSGMDLKVFQKYGRASDIAEEIELAKADAPVLTSTTAVRNVLSPNQMRSRCYQKDLGQSQVTEHLRLQALQQAAT